MATTGTGFIANPKLTKELTQIGKTLKEAFGTDIARELAKQSKKSLKNQEVRR